VCMGNWLTVVSAILRRVAITTVLLRAGRRAPAAALRAEARPRLGPLLEVRLLEALLLRVLLPGARLKALLLGALLLGTLLRSLLKALLPGLLLRSLLEALLLSALLLGVLLLEALLRPLRVAARLSSGSRGPVRPHRGAVVLRRVAPARRAGSESVAAAEYRRPGGGRDRRPAVVVVSAQ